MKKEKIELDFDYETMGSRIAKRRKLAKYTQAQLAELIPLSNVHVSNIENGNEHPSFPVFIRICQILNINPDYLILGNIRSNGVSEEIYKSLSLISNERDIGAIQNMIEYFIDDINV